MERIEYRNIRNKSDWPHGPWTDEPDKIQWQDDATGLPCLIVRGPSGSLCGYVGVPPGHRYHGKDYDDCDVEVHGGLTFADNCAEITPERWEKWRQRLLSRRDEAKKYPVGDAANYLRDWARELESYEAWVEKAHASYICHVPAPGEPDPVWWLGFDCAHVGDISPSSLRFGSSDFEDVYRDIKYVETEVCSLAQQLARP